MASSSNAKSVHIEIKTRSVCVAARSTHGPMPKIGRQIFGSWGSPSVVARSNLWHPGEPLPEELTQAIAQQLPIISFDAPFKRALFINIMGPRYDWPIPPIEQWVCTAAMAAAMSLPRSLDDVARAMGISESKDREAQS